MSNAMTGPSACFAGRPNRLARALATAAAVLLLAAACGNGGSASGDGDTAAGGASGDGTAGSASSAPKASDGGGEDSSSPSEHTADSPKEQLKGQDCGTIFEDWRAVIGTPGIECAVARDVLTEYQRTARSGSTAMPTSDADVARGWSCTPHRWSDQQITPDTYSMWCTRGSQVVLTVANGAPILEGVYVDPSDHLFVQPGGYTQEQVSFTSPSKKWECGIYPEEAGNAALNGWTGCHGPMPKGIEARAADGPEPAMMQSDGVEMKRGTKAVPMVSLERYFYQGPTLDYGKVLYANGSACTVDKRTGVTCSNGAHGFTVSSQEAQFG